MPKNKPPKFYTPEQPNAYQGRQIILNSDRLLFNAREDSILMFADKSIGLNSPGSIHFDTGENPKKSYFIVNSPNIYLGMEGNTNTEFPKEPAVLGFKLVEYLNDVLDIIESLYMFLLVEYTVTAPKEAGESAPGENDMTGEFKQVDLLRKKLNGKDGLDPFASLGDVNNIEKTLVGVSKLKRFDGSGILSKRVKLV